MKIKKSYGSKLMIIGLILIGVGFFGIAKAVELPAGFQPPVNPNEKLSEDTKKIPTDVPQEPVAFKQINLLLSDLKLNKTEYSSGDTVKGNFKLKNDSNMYSSGFYYQVALHKPDTSQENVVIFNQLTTTDYIRSELINVAPQEEKTFSFSYKIPKFCSSGSDYSIQVTVLNSRGFELANGFQSLTVNNLSGDERFIFLDQTKSQVFTSTKPYRIQDGGVFEYDKEYNPAMEKDKPNKDITLKNEVQTRVAYSIKKNPKEKSVAKVSFYKYGNYLNVLKSKTFEISDLNDSGSFDLKLPLFPDPGNYEAVVQLFVGEEKVSNPLIIRYTTQGDSGLVYDFLVEKNGGNNFTLNLLWAGPADSNVRVAENGFSGAQILFEAREEKTQKLCFEKTIEIDPKQGSITQLPFVMGDCSSPYQFSAKLQKDGKILDQQQFSELKKEEVKKETENKDSVRNIILLSFGVLTVVLLLIVFLGRKKTAKPIFMIVLSLMISFGLFGLFRETKAAHAGTFNFHTSSGGTYRFIYNHPLWMSSYTPPSCPSGYSFPLSQADWGPVAVTYSCCAGSGCYITDWGCCTNDGFNTYCTTDCIQPIPGYWTPYIYGYWAAYDYYLVNYKTNFNYGETLSFYEAVHAHPNCGNGGGPGPGASYYYLYSQATGALVWQGAYSFNEYSGGASINIPLNFAPGGYTFVIYGWKTFFGGEDDPMYNGSISIVGNINIINSNPTLSVTKTGSGTISGTNIDCGLTCSATYPLNSAVSLTANPSDPNSTFSGWGGDCAGFGTNPTCNLTMNTSKNVVANFSCSCSSGDSANYCEGTPYTNSCGASCTGTKPIEPWTPSPSTQCTGTSFTQTSNCGSTRTATGTMPTLNGQCGEAASKLWEIKPNSDLCSIGTASDPTTSENQWCWNCSGICGGSATECCAQRDSNWKEVAP